MVEFLKMVRFVGAKKCQDAKKPQASGGGDSIWPDVWPDPVTIAFVTNSINRRICDKDAQGNLIDLGAHSTRI